MMWLFFIPLIINGLGRLDGIFDIRIYYLFLGGFLYFFLIKAKKPIRFPVFLTVIFLSFIILNFISGIFFSVNRQTSVLPPLFYLSVFLIFIFFYNQKERGKRIITCEIIGGGIIFSLICLFSRFLPWRVSTDYQLILSLTSTHNHLGDYLGLFLILMVYLAIDFKKIKSLVSGLLMGLFFGATCLFVISFSRNAYLALFLTSCLFILSKGPFIKKTPTIVATILLLIIFFSTVKETSNLPVLNNLNQFFSHELNLPKKDLSSGRFSYFDQAYQSIKDRPWFGVGGDNFRYVSNRYLKSAEEFSETTHNLLMEIVATIGIPAGVLLFILLMLILISGLKQKTRFFYLFFYLLVIFHTDYIYKIDSLLVLFFVLGAMLYEEKNNFTSDNLFGIFALIGPIFIWFYITSNLFLKMGYSDIAFRLNSFNKGAMQQEIVKKYNERDLNSFNSLTNSYERYFQDDLLATNFLVDLYTKIGLKYRALNIYKKTYQNNRFLSFEYIKRIYFLTKEVEGEVAAYRFLFNALTNLDSIRWRSTLFNEEIIKFCHKVENKACWQTGWW